jgi:hypothetical protein
MRLFRRSAPGRVLRPSWHSMVISLSTGAALFAFTRNARLTYASVLGGCPRHVLALFYIPSADQRMGYGATRGVRQGRGGGAS